MPERIEWLDDGSVSGTPYSPRFADRYRSELGGIRQAQEVFLAGCGLPQAWSGQAQWCILETGFGLGLNFLATWAAWKADLNRPRLLHFVSTEAYPASAADVLRSVADLPELLPFARQLQAQLWGLLPGIHRLVFEDGQLLLTLCIGDAKAVLRQQQFEADSVYLDGFSPQKNPAIWDIHTFKAVARCCRRGTRIATWTVARSVRDALTQCGFVVKKAPGTPPKRDMLQGEYDPHWEPKKPVTKHSPLAASTCVVIGAGLAGAAVAASLARRGWKVTVLDAANTPASGASGLPAGLLVPHVSPDDSLLSRLSRSGVRLTLQQAQALLQQGTDWNATGVLEHGVDGMPRTLPGWSQDWPDAAADWSRAATAEQLAQCGLPATSLALWHKPAAWIKPSSLVQAWLAGAGIEWRGHARAAQLRPGPLGWQVLDASGQLLAEAQLVVVAAAFSTQGLAAQVQAVELALQPVRGQVSWGRHPQHESHDPPEQTPFSPPLLPPFPVNGHGGLMPAVPGPDGLRWIMGATYERGSQSLDVQSQDHQQNLARLQVLLPKTAAQLAGEFADAGLQAWTGVRCATPARLPVLGPIATSSSGAQIWVCTGMGSRGLTFAALCAELLAARLHGEPLPLEKRLAQALELELPQSRTPAAPVTSSPQPDAVP